MSSVELRCGSKAADFVYDFISLSYGTCFPDGSFRLKHTTMAMATTTGHDNGLSSIQWNNVTVDPGSNSCFIQLAGSCMLLVLAQLAIYE